MMSMGERLTRYLSEPAIPFDWATASCAHWAAGWVLHATGVTVNLPDFHDVRSARRVVKEAGGVAATVSAALGVPAILWARAQIGDLMMLPSDSDGVGYVLGICNGHVAAVRDEFGAVHFVPCSTAEAAWSMAAVEEAKQ